MVMLLRLLCALCAFIFSISASAVEGEVNRSSLTFVRPNIAAANAECYNSILRAIPSFYRESKAAQEFNTRDLLVYSIASANDMMCSGPEMMANVTIIVEDPMTREKWYGVFHVHVTQDGSFTSGSSYYNPEWVPFKGSHEWQTRWCDYISTTYPEDHKAQCRFTRRKE